MPVFFSLIGSEVKGIASPRPGIIDCSGVDPEWDSTTRYASVFLTVHPSNAIPRRKGFRAISSTVVPGLAEQTHPTSSEATRPYIDGLSRTSRLRRPQSNPS